MTKSNEREPLPLTGSKTPWPLLSGQRIWIGGSDLEVRRALELRMTGALRPAVGRLDVAFVTPSSADEASYFAAKLRDRLTGAGELWVFFFRSQSDESGAGEKMTPELFNGAVKRVGFQRAGATEPGDGLTGLRFELNR